jgi:hypothetical protein
MLWFFVASVARKIITHQTISITNPIIVFNDLFQNIKILSSRKGGIIYAEVNLRYSGTSDTQSKSFTLALSPLNVEFFNAIYFSII